MRILSTSFGLISLIALIISSCTSHAQTVSLEVTEAFPNLFFGQPTDIQNAGDESNRLFVCDKEGRIYVFDNNPETNEHSLFLDISDRIVTISEMGLLGLAFHPNFQENGYFFIHYNVRRGNDLLTVIARLSVDSEDPNRADPSSELVVMEFVQPFANHDGGRLRLDQMTAIST